MILELVEIDRAGLDEDRAEMLGFIVSAHRDQQDRTAAMHAFTQAVTIRVAHHLERRQAAPQAPLSSH